MKKTIISLISYAALTSMLVAADQTPQVVELASRYKGIVKLDVTLWQKVKKGDLLFELNQDINNAKLELNEKDAKTMKPIIEGAEKLIEAKAISKEVYEDASYWYKDNQIETGLIRAEMAASKYYSPIDGTVTKIYRYDGSGLGDNDPEVEVTQEDVSVNTANQVAMVCMGGKDPSVLDLKVKLGQEVKKGDLLFTQKDIDLLKLQLSRDENTLVKAKQKYERQSVLYDKQASSLHKKLLAEFDYNKAQADVKIDKIRIDQASYYAPFGGTITKVYRCDGTGMGSGKPVVDITAIN